MKKQGIIRLLATFLVVVMMLTMFASCEMLQGLQGPQGEQGLPGKDGKDGKDGATPTIEISEDGYWIINGVKTEYRVCTCGEKDDVAYIREGNYIYFGEYPQTIKADDVTVTSTTDSRGYYLGSDGFYYAKITANVYGNGSIHSYTFSSGTTVTSGEVYYFKVEPIRWRILAEDGENAFILCDSIIANRRYDDDSKNYAESEIRQWLNSTFYEIAFTELQRGIILTTTVDNSANSTGSSNNPYVCEDTEDKIFLLSYAEVTNTEYGFLTDKSEKDTARIMQTSDYSRATGAYTNFTTSESYMKYNGNGYWWLRSPVSSSFTSAQDLLEDGRVTSDNTPCTHVGVVPAMWINLET